MKELVKRLYDNPEKFNYETVREIRKYKGKINKYLLEELDNNIENFDINEGISIFGIYALFLLAEFKEKKLFPLIIKMVSIHNFDGYQMLGDGVMEKLPSIIASVFDGNFKSLNGIIENKNIDYYIRSDFLETYIYFYKNNLINKKELIDYLRTLIKIYNYEDDEIYNSILTIIINTRLVEMIEDVKELFDENLIDYNIRGGYDDFIDYLFSYNPILLDDVLEINNIEDYMKNWYCFNNDKEDDAFDVEKLAKGVEKYIKEDIKRNVNDINYNKVGRNDPCPCGSGKKFKKCCLNNCEQRLPYQNYIDKSLEDYPKKAENQELDFYTFYDEEHIKIDKLLYKAMKRKRISIFIDRNINKENNINYNYLKEAYSLIKDVILENDIKSIKEYDEKISIHYSLITFYVYYTKLIVEIYNSGKKEIIEELKEIITYFYKTLEIEDKWEWSFFKSIEDYCIITKKYDESIKYFENRLNNKYCAYDAGACLFRIYSYAFNYDDCIKKMDDIIDKEKNKDLQNYLFEIKQDFIDDSDY